MGMKRMGSSLPEVSGVQAQHRLRVHPVLGAALADIPASKHNQSIKKCSQWMSSLG